MFESPRRSHGFVPQRGARSCPASLPGLLGAMLHRDGSAREGDWSPPDGRPHFPPKAKSVIWLFMNGGVSHVESFDPKPMLTKYGGKTIAETPFADAQDPKKLAIERLVVPDANGNQRNTLYPLQVGFRKHGQSGIEVSDWFPHIARHVDRLAIVRSMWTTDSNHGAQTQFHSGRHQNDGDFPTLGAWVHYGLGSLNDNLPQFISFGTREYWNKKDGHYLGPAHDAVPLRVDPDNPLDFGQPERPVSRRGASGRHRPARGAQPPARRRSPRDAALAARVASYELAFRMQRSVPEAVDFRQESDADESPLRPRTCRIAASSACRCWRRVGWSSGGSGSSRCSTAGAAPAPGTLTAG